MPLEHIRPTEDQLILAIPGTQTEAPEAFPLVTPALREFGDVDFLNLTPDVLGNRDTLLEAAESRMKKRKYGSAILLGVSIGGIVAYEIASDPRWQHPTDLILANTPHSEKQVDTYMRKLLETCRRNPKVGRRLIEIFLARHQTPEREFDDEVQTLAYKEDMGARARTSPDTLEAQVQHFARASVDQLTLPTTTQVVHIVSSNDTVVMPDSNSEAWLAHHQSQNREPHFISIEGAAHAELTAEPELWIPALSKACKILRRQPKFE